MKTIKRFVAALLTYLLVGCFAISYVLVCMASVVYLVGCRAFGIAPEQYPPRDPR